MTGCACGCGRTTSIATENDKRFGWAKGQHKKYIRGHNARGCKRIFSESHLKKMSEASKSRFADPTKHPRWKGGISHAKGYVWLRVPGHPRANRHGYVKRCILVLEEIFGPLIIPEGYEPHHNDEDKINDHPLNLAIMSHKDHARHHLKKYMPRHYRRLRNG